MTAKLRLADRTHDLFPILGFVAALASLATAGWHDTLVTAVMAAAARGRELGAELGKD